MKEFVYASAKVRGAISLMSAPAANAFCEPVRTMTDVSLDALKSVSASLSSLISGVQSALRAFGLFRVTG